MRVFSRRRLLALLVTVPAVGLATWPKLTAASTPAVVEENRYFSALSHNVPSLLVTISGEQHNVDFLGFYERTGDLTRWGYPTSEVMEETPGTLTQYYQRGVVDWQPLPEGGYGLQRRLAWDFIGGGVNGAPDLGVEGQLVNPQTGDQEGPWGHKVSNWSVEGTYTGFKDFFDGQGGVEAFGYPKADARRDDHPQAVLTVPGSTRGFIRQYFQAVVLEFHAGDPGPVKIGLVGDTLRDLKYRSGTWATLRPFQSAAPLDAGPTEILTIPELAPTPTPTAAPTPTPTSTPTPAPTPRPSLTVVPGDIDTQANYQWLKPVAEDYFFRARNFLGEPRNYTLTINVGSQYRAFSRSNGSVDLSNGYVEKRLIPTPLLEITQALWGQLRTADQWFFKGTSNTVAYLLAPEMSHLGIMGISEAEQYQDDMQAIRNAQDRGDELVFAPLNRFTFDFTGEDGTVREYRFGSILRRTHVRSMYKTFLGLDGLSLFYKDLLRQPVITNALIGDIAVNYVSPENREAFRTWYNQRVFVGFAL